MRTKLLARTALATLLFGFPLAAAAQEAEEETAASGSILGQDWTMLRYNEEANILHRFGMNAVEHSGLVYYMGGYNDNRWKNDVWQSADGDDWLLLTGNAAWRERAFFGLVSHGEALYVLGGSGHEVYGDVWRSEDGIEWTEMPVPPWADRSHHAAVYHDGRIYVMGGFGNRQRFNDVWASDDGEEWELVRDNAPWAARSHLSATVHNGYIYITGGGTWNAEERQHEYFNDVWRSRNGADWEAVTLNADWTPRFSPGLVSLKGHLWLIGGDDRTDTTGIRRDVWRSADGGEWTLMIDPTAWARMVWTSIFTFDERLWVIGGVNYGGGLFDRGHRVYYSEGEVE